MKVPLPNKYNKCYSVLLYIYMDVDVYFDRVKHIMLNYYSSSNTFNVSDNVFLIHCSNSESHCDK